MVKGELHRLNAGPLYHRKRDVVFYERVFV